MPKAKRQSQAVATPLGALTRTILFSGILFGCLPAQLDKYRTQDQRLRPSGEAVPLMTARPVAANAGDFRQAAAGPAAAIYAVDAQTFRIAPQAGDVWDALITVLLHNYNLTIADRQAGLLSTEWDSYYLGTAVYRNKLSLRLARLGLGPLELTIHNNVERLRDAAQAAGTMGAVWLPVADPANEVSRVVQNLALVLGQPPPVLPPTSSALAKAADSEPAGPEMAKLSR